MNSSNSLSRDVSLIFSDVLKNGSESSSNASNSSSVTSSMTSMRNHVSSLDVSGFKVFSESDAYNKYGIRLMLAPRSAKARYSTEFAKDINECLYALSDGGSVLVCLEEDGSTSFLASSTLSSLSSWMIVVLAFGLTGGSYVLQLRVNTTFTCSFRAGDGR
ncbi:hypothetical protein Tco_1550960, partial [Tanacetum coccineum]